MNKIVKLMGIGFGVGAGMSFSFAETEAKITKGNGSPDSFEITDRHMVFTNGFNVEARGMEALNLQSSDKVLFEDISQNPSNIKGLLSIKGTPLNTLVIANKHGITAEGCSFDGVNTVVLDGLGDGLVTLKNLRDSTCTVVQVQNFSEVRYSYDNLNADDVFKGSVKFAITGATPDTPVTVNYHNSGSWDNCEGEVLKTVKLHGDTFKSKRRRYKRNVGIESKIIGGSRKSVKDKNIEPIVFNDLIQTTTVAAFATALTTSTAVGSDASAQAGNQQQQSASALGGDANVNNVVEVSEVVENGGNSSSDGIAAGSADANNGVVSVAAAAVDDQPQPQPGQQAPAAQQPEPQVVDAPAVQPQGSAGVNNGVAAAAADDQPQPQPGQQAPEAQQPEPQVVAAQAVQPQGPAGVNNGVAVQAGQPQPQLRQQALVVQQPAHQVVAAPAGQPQNPAGDNDDVDPEGQPQPQLRQQALVVQQPAHQVVAAPAGQPQNPAGVNNDVAVQAQTLSDNLGITNGAQPSIKGSFYDQGSLQTSSTSVQRDAVNWNGVTEENSFFAISQLNSSFFPQEIQEAFLKSHEDLAPANS